MFKTRFKKSEWHHGVSKASLKEMLGDYYNEFGLNDNEGWTEAEIWNFLRLKHWLYRESFPQLHHHQTIVSILKEVLI